MLHTTVKYIMDLSNCPGSAGPLLRSLVLIRLIASPNCYRSTAIEALRLGQPDLLYEELSVDLSLTINKC